jgi:hypothetical protein
VVISPRPTHSFWVSMVRSDVVVVRELFVADGAYSLLLCDFPLQKSPHFGWGSEFSISSRMMGIFNASNSGLYGARALRLFPTAAAE